MTKPTKLIYDDRPHTYYVDGKRWSGASNYGKVIEDQSTLLEWKPRQAIKGVALDEVVRDAVLLNLNDKDKLDELVEAALTAAGANDSREYGKKVHRITEQHDKDLLPVRTPGMLDVIKRWEDVLANHEITVHPDLVERIVINPEFKCCGTGDRWVTWQQRSGRLIVLDIKTGSMKYRHSMCVQLALLASAPWITANGYTRNEKTTFTEFDPMPEVDQEIGLIVSMPSDGSDPAVYELPLADGLRAARLAKEAKEWTSKEVGRVLVAVGGGGVGKPKARQSSSLSASTAGTTTPAAIAVSDESSTSSLTATASTSRVSESSEIAVTKTAGGTGGASTSTDPFAGIATQEPAAWLTVASTATPSSASDPATAGETPGAAKTPHDAQRAELQRRIDRVKQNPLATADLTLWWTKLPKWADCGPEHYADVAAMLDDIEALHEFSFDPPVVELAELPPDPVKPPRVTTDLEAVAAALAAVAALTGPAAAFWNAIANGIVDAGGSIDPRKGPETDRPRRLEVLRAVLAWCEHHDEDVLRAGLALCLGDDAVQPAFSTGALLASLKVGEATALRKVAEGYGTTFEDDMSSGELRLRRVA
jgi:hypothetical protein